MLYNILGAACIGLEDFVKADTALSKAAALDPTDAEIHNNHGIALGSLGRLDEAIAAYRRALAIRPDYLKTHGHDGIVNYSEWSVPLGRRFRALKLWFLLRAHGLESLRRMIRSHVAWSGNLAARLGLELQQRAADLSLAEVFRLEYLVALHCAAHGDFAEGIRALLIDKDRQPRWNPATLAQATRTWAAPFFRAPAWPGGVHPLADLGRSTGVPA